MRCIKISPLPSCKWLTYYQSGLIEGRINWFSIIGTRTKQMDLHRFHLDDQHWLHNTACVLNSLPPPRHVPTSASMAAKGTPLTKQIQLPSPTVESGQDVPLTSFASKLFMQKAAYTSNTINLDRHSSHESEVQLKASEVKDKEEYVIDKDNDDLHLPAGQHLLVDIKHVNPYFLNSEVRLAEAMIKLTKTSNFTLLSYHCHTWHSTPGSRRESLLWICSPVARRL